MTEILSVQPTNNDKTDINFQGVSDKLDNTKLDNMTTAQLSRVDTSLVNVGTQVFDKDTNTTYELISESGTKSWRAMSNTGTESITGLEMTWLSVSAISVSAGTVQFGNEVLSKTTATTINFTGLSASTWYYIYLAKSGTTFTMSYRTNAPDKSDISGNSAGRLIYYTTGGVYYRCIGAVYSNSSSQVLAFYQHGDYIEFTTFQTIKSGVQAAITAVDCLMPAISNVGTFTLYHKVGTGSGLHFAYVYRDNAVNLLAIVRDFSNSVGVEYVDQFITYTVARQLYYKTKNQAVGADGVITLNQMGFYINVR